MIVRLLVMAGLAGASLAAGTSAMAQSMPLGPMMNAAGRAQQAGTPASSPEPGRVIGSGPGQGRALPSRPASSRPFSDKPARRKHPVNISRDNG